MFRSKSKRSAELCRKSGRTIFPSTDGVGHTSDVDQLDTGKDRIRVNCICPGGIVTPITGDRVSDREHALAQSRPIHCAGQPGDIAAMALFLASDESEWVTGAAMLVDGGFMARAHALGSRSATDFLAPGFAGPSFQLRR